MFWRYSSPYLNQCPSYCSVDISKSMEDTVYLAALNYQVDKLYDDMKDSYTGNLVLPKKPEPMKKAGRFCSTILRITKFAGLITETPSSIFVVYRGTKGALEGITDARAIVKTSFPNGGNVHRGFYNLYSTTRETIFNKLKGMDGNKTLYVVGHSLGGAMATLCALDLALDPTIKSKFKNPVVCTFGSPRVGDQQFVNTFNATINTSVRVVNKMDWVPCVPLEDMGYVHVKGEFTFCVDNGFSTNVFINHLLNTAYFPGMANLYPDYASQLCTANPGFCPLPYDAKFCSDSTKGICSEVEKYLHLHVKNTPYACRY